MTDEVDLCAAAGWVEPELHTEFSQLGLDWVTVETGRGGSPRHLKERLRDLSNTYRGANVVALRQQPVTHAYRVFFREVGLDPDVTRIPLEQAALSRLMHGQFVSRGLLEDALLVALIETGVGVWALDADLVDAGGLGIRTAVDGDRLGRTEYGRYLQAGQLVVADARWVQSILFGEIAPGHAPTAQTNRVMLFAVRVDGVPAIHVEEALWMCVEALRTG